MIKRGMYYIKRGTDTFFGYPVAAFSASTAFFFLISAFPFAMLTITLIGMIPGLETQMLQSELVSIMPDVIKNFINLIFDEISRRSNATMISLAAIASLYAASRGFNSLIRGMNLVYGIREQRNFFAVLGMSILCTLSLMAAILITLVVLVFGQNIIDLLVAWVPGISDGFFLFIGFRILVIFLFLTALFLILYLTVPSRRSTFKNELPGAMFSALGWIGFSLLYSLYLQYATTYLYGSLTATVFIMLWLYACIFILFVGGELNCFLQLKYPNFFRKKANKNVERS